MIRNIQISAFVDHSQPYKNVEADKRIISGAVKWLRLGIIPVVAVSPFGLYVRFFDDLPMGTIPALKIGNRMTAMGDAAGVVAVADEILCLPPHSEVRLENESMLGEHWRAKEAPSVASMTVAFDRFPKNYRYVWQTGFFDARQTGLTYEVVNPRMRDVAKVLRSTLNARFVTNRLAKPPTLKNQTPGKPDIRNNDWWNKSAETLAAPFIDADHPEVCQVYSNKLYGKGGKTCRYWLQEEYGQALQLGRISGADIAFDPGASGWDDQAELDAWERAIDEQRRRHEET